MNRWMVSAALIAAAGVLYAETVRFDDEPQKMLTVKTRRKEMKTVPLFDGGGRTNFRFAAEFQTFNLNPAGQHCGFLLVGSRRKLHLLTRGDTVNYVPLSGGEEAIGPIAPKLSGTLSNAWTKLELEYRGDLEPVSLVRMMRAINHPGDWIHLAFVYDNSGWSTIYVNALPYKIGSTWMDEKPVRIGNFDFGKVKQLLVGSASRGRGTSRCRSR